MELNDKQIDQIKRVLNYAAMNEEIDFEDYIRDGHAPETHILFDVLELREALGEPVTITSYITIEEIVGGTVAERLHRCAKEVQEAEA